MARKRGGLRTSVYQGWRNPSILLQTAAPIHELVGHQLPGNFRCSGSDRLSSLLGCSVNVEHDAAEDSSAAFIHRETRYMSRRIVRP